MAILEKSGKQEFKCQMSSNPIALRAYGGKYRSEARKRLNLTKVGGEEHKVVGTNLKVDGAVSPQNVLETLPEFGPKSRVWLYQID